MGCAATLRRVEGSPYREVLPDPEGRVEPLVAVTHRPPSPWEQIVGDNGRFRGTKSAVVRLWGPKCIHPCRYRRRNCPAVFAWPCIFSSHPMVGQKPPNTSFSTPNGANRRLPNRWIRVPFACLCQDTAGLGLELETTRSKSLVLVGYHQEMFACGSTGPMSRGENAAVSIDSIVRTRMNTR